MKLKEVDQNELSPMMKQYAQIKKNYENEILFYRVGDFYELFFEDALLACRELELTLTGKSAGLSEKIPMSGVPHHSIKPYIERLVNKGYKVAICDQVEDAKHAKGMVRREVTQVVSKGTMVDLEFLNAKDFNFIGSIIDNGYSYLITYADVSTGNLYSELIKHNSDELLNRVLNLNLKELILKNDFSIEVINIFKNTYNINISLSDHLYEEKLEILKNIKDANVLLGIKHLIYYLVVKLLKEIDHFSEVIIKDNDAYLLMDVHTITNLELFETLRLKEREYSLIWLIDKCKTAMGSRTLKGFLMNPLKDEKNINERLDIIEKLNNEFILRSELLEALYEVYDLERLCGKVVCGSLNARDVLQIKRSLHYLPKIKEIIKDLELKININEHQDLFELLEKAIYEEPPVTIKEGYLIKAGFNRELDELKEIRSGGKDFIAQLEATEREKTGIPNLKVGFNKVFGYYIEISKSHVNKIKPEYGWERRQTIANGERYITPLLKEKEAMVLNAEERIVELEYNLFLEIKETIKKSITSLKEVAQNLGTIDALTSLSVISETQKLVRPRFNSQKIINIKNGFHPVVEQVSNVPYVKNDIIMDETTSTLLITGPNMSGKSTYMRQLAITIIMAQIGSFVPADEANLPIFDHIFTRIGASDDLVSGNSTFMIEMLEAKNAIVNATTNSLILFDELGRGTATYDGMSLAEAILEYVNLNIKCKTLFSTHYHELTSLENRIDGIKNIHVSATEEDGKLVFLHKVKEGAVDKSYGIHVAQIAGIPDQVIKRANELLDFYEQEGKVINDKPIQQLSFNLTETNEIKERLKTIDPLKVTPLEALTILAELKDLSKK